MPRSKRRHWLSRRREEAQPHWRESACIPNLRFGVVKIRSLACAAFAVGGLTSVSAPGYIRSGDVSTGAGGALPIMGFRLRAYARENRRSWLARRIASQCEKFLHGYFNQGYFEFDK